MSLRARSLCVVKRDLNSHSGEKFLIQNGAGKLLKPYINPTKPVEIIAMLCYRPVNPCSRCYVQRTHSQVSPDDAVVGAPLSDAAAVRRPRHAHGAAPPVVLRTDVRLQHRCETHTRTHIRQRVYCRLFTS